MTSIQQLLLASLTLLGPATCGLAVSAADPESVGSEQDPISLAVPMAGPGEDAAALACRRFDAVVRVSSDYYNDFAYAIAGNGSYVDYRDPVVRAGNVDGRTALRQAAGEARGAASAPGVPAEIADPMRAWAWQAWKLVVVMGMRGNGDTLNTTASELNDHAEQTQLACARATPTYGGTP